MTKIDAALTCFAIFFGLVLLSNAASSFDAFGMKYPPGYWGQWILRFYRRLEAETCKLINSDFCDVHPDQCSENSIIDRFSTNSTASIGQQSYNIHLASRFDQQVLLNHYGNRTFNFDLNALLTDRSRRRRPQRFGWCHCRLTTQPRRRSSSTNLPRSRPFEGPRRIDSNLNELSGIRSYSRQE